MTQDNPGERQGQHDQPPQAGEEQLRGPRWSSPSEYQPGASRRGGSQPTPPPSAGAGSGGNQPPPPPRVTPPGSAPPPPPPGGGGGGRGYYQGPWPPEGFGQQRDGFWSVVWRTTTRTLIIAGVGGAAFITGMFIFFIIMGLVISAVVPDTEVDPDTLDTQFLFGDRDSDNELLALRAEGIILGERQTATWLDAGFVYGYEVKDQLRQAARDDSINGVVIKLASPGGTIFGSQAIADGIAGYREATGNPVVVYIEGLAASGGIWAMAPADLILADYGSSIGNIGVIMGPFTHYDGVVELDEGILGGSVTTTDGITTEYITAGRSKDIGNPWRPMTDEERDVLQQNVDNEYDIFVQHIEEWMGIPADVIREDMGAHIFDNLTAQEFGLVDGTASMERAFAELADMAGLEGDDWQVRDVDPGLGFLGGLFAEGEIPDGELEELLGPAPEACFPRGTALAFHGDPEQLCWQ